MNIEILQTSMSWFALEINGQNCFVFGSNGNNETMKNSFTDDGQQLKSRDLKVLK